MSPTSWQQHIPCSAPTGTLILLYQLSENSWHSPVYLQRKTETRSLGKVVLFQGIPGFSSTDQKGNSLRTLGAGSRPSLECKVPFVWCSLLSTLLKICIHHIEMLLPVILVMVVATHLFLIWLLPFTLRQLSLGWRVWKPCVTVVTVSLKLCLKKIYYYNLQPLFYHFSSLGGCVCVCILSLCIVFNSLWFQNDAVLRLKRNKCLFELWPYAAWKHIPVVGILLMLI